MAGFSDRIKGLREARGWSKTYTAKRIGASTMQTYANWEYGRTEPDFATVSKLADLFEVSTDYLLTGAKKPMQSIEEHDLSKALNAARSFDGKPLTDHDRKVVKGILQSYFQ